MRPQLITIRAALKEVLSKLLTWWVPLRIWQKTALLLALILPTGFWIGRGSKNKIESSFDDSLVNQKIETKRGERPKAEQPAESREQASWGASEIFIVDRKEHKQFAEERRMALTPEEMPRLSEASLLQSFVVWATFDQLDAGKAYTANCLISVPNGAKIQGDAVQFRADANGKGWATFPITPKTKQHSAGQWACSVTIRGINNPLQGTFTVSAPTGGELAELNEYEEALFHAKSAFAKTWTQVSEDRKLAYAVNLSETAVQPQSQQEIAEERPAISAKQFSLIANGIENPKVDEKVAPAIHLFEIGGLRIRPAKLELTKADQFNGISYQGIILFEFDVFREYLPDKNEWTQWAETRPPVDNVLEEGFEFYKALWETQGPTAKNLIVRADQQAPSLKFVVHKRDGHWIVQGQSGIECIDGRVTVENLAALKAEKGTLRSGKATQPDKMLVKELSAAGRTERDRLLQIAKSLEATPEVAKQQEADTIESIK